MAKKIPFIWTNDDLGYGRGPNLRQMLDFLKRYNIPGSFAVVPITLGKDGPQYIYDDVEMRKEFDAALAGGHELFQHGTTHVCRENGIADIRMFHQNLMGNEDAKEMSRRRLYYENYWTLDAITAQVDWGRQVWIKTFGRPSIGFRPGCGSFCANLFPALLNLGFKWTSATEIVSFTGWLWYAGQDNYPFEMTPPVRGYRKYKNLAELPVLDDICFRVKADQVDRFVELGWRYWEQCVEKNYPYVLLSHWHGLEANGSTGYQVHEKLLPRILETGLADAMTLSQYHEKLERGEYPWADPTELPPPAEQAPDWHVWHYFPKKS